VLEEKAPSVLRSHEPMGAYPVTRTAKHFLIFAASIALFGVAPYFARGYPPPMSDLRRSSTPQNRTTLLVKESAQRASLESGCRAVRKRMWVESEGWIVRTVQICQ
jgi:hypothetical protein